jgi:hypothetical protein
MLISFSTGCIFESQPGNRLLWEFPWFCSVSVGNSLNVKFEVFTAVAMENVVFWDVASCRYCVNRCFGGTYRLHLQGRRKNPRAKNQREQVATVCSHLLTLVPRLRVFSTTLNTEAIRSSETSVYTISTWRHIPEDGSLQFAKYSL